MFVKRVVIANLGEKFSSEIAKSWSAVNKTRIGSLGSDRTGIFAFSAEELFSEKLLLIMWLGIRND